MFRASRVPPLSVLLDDLTTQDAKKIAKHLGVSVKTLQRWKATDKAPRAALLALFYETRWGYSTMYTTMFNECRMLAGIAEMMTRKNAALQLKVEQLERLGDFGSANDPSVSTHFNQSFDSFLERWTKF